MAVLEENRELVKTRPMKQKPSMANKQEPLNVPIKSESNKRKRATCTSIYDNGEVKSAVMKQAEEIQANLAPEFPSIIKLMLPSHVTGGFWLGLPKAFCRNHMPEQDTMIALEDEKGDIYQAKYLVEKIGLSGGWRGFSMAHKLLAGDVLVFQLVKPTKFKVYIVRVSGSEEIGGALGLLKLDACKNRMSPIHEENLSLTREEEMAYQEIHLLLAEGSGSSLQQAWMKIYENFAAPSNESENEQRDPGFEIIDGISIPDYIHQDFKEVKSLKDFKIIVHGLYLTTHDLSIHLQAKYYELCCSQQSFLHDNIIKGLNLKLYVGIIAETINIADAIRTTKLTTYNADDFADWKTTLKSFQMMGMNVDFLLARVDQLTNIAVKSERRKEARVERDHEEEQVRTLEVKLAKLKEAISELDNEIQNLKSNEQNLKLKFQQIANAPW